MVRKALTGLPFRGADARIVDRRFPRRGGSGECRVPVAPAASCAKVESTRVITTVAPGHPAFPHAMVLTAYIVLSPATNSSCHRHRRIEGFAAPGRADLTSADLTPATGARTTRFCRPLQSPFVCVSSIAHRSCRPALQSRFTPDAAASTASRARRP
jgi:hypothetical protein